MKFRDSGKTVYFIHIPRTAGSYIEDQLCKKFKINKKWPNVNEDNLFGLKKISSNQYLTLQHLTLKEIEKFGYIDVKENNYIFTVVRNPFERIISLFLNWFRKYITLDLFLLKLMKMDLNNYPFTGIVTMRQDFNYQNMLRKIEDVKYFVLPQYYYINNDKFDVDVIKFEDIEKLNNKLGINVKYRKRKDKFYLTKSQIQKIILIYKKDFEYFNFSTTY